LPAKPGETAFNAAHWQVSLGFDLK